MPASTVPSANLTPDAAAAIAARLGEYKQRNDIEVLAVTSVASGRLFGPWSSAPALEFTVEFTYTTGRRQRRTATVAWALTPSRTERFPGVPEPVWELLRTALAATYGA